MKLTDKESTIVRSILSTLIPNREIWAFGSRICGHARKFSDLDLALITDKPIDFGKMGMIREAFSESDLPFFVDIIDWSTMSESFRDIVRARHEVFTI